MLQLRRTLHQSFCRGNVHQTLSILEILDPHNMRHAHLQDKYLTNPLVTPEDQVIAAAARLTNALQGINQPQQNTSTL
jgi:hypothetical protein